MGIFNISDDGTHEVTAKTIQEAIEEGFSFKIFEGAESKVVDGADIEIKQNGIEYTYDSVKRIIKFQRFSLQVLPSSKTVNIVENPSSKILAVAALFPLLTGMLVLSLSSEIAEFVGGKKEFFEGFAIAIVIIGYITQIGSVFYTKSLRKRNAMHAVTVSSSLINKLEKASDVEEYFSRLIQVNLNNMEQYYLLVRNQTEKSYKLTQAASVIGLLILTAGILLSFSKGIESTPTSLTIASGILVEFISAIFFYIYNKTVSQLNTYHEKLVNVQDTMLALKVAQTVKDEKKKDETMVYLTKALTSKLAQVDRNVSNKSSNADAVGAGS